MFGWFGWCDVIIEFYVGILGMGVGVCGVGSGLGVLMSIVNV